MSSPFFHGIEHLTIDDEGYVSWRGKRVEHFEPDFAQTDAAKGKARILAARCKHLEAIGKDVNKFNLGSIRVPGSYVSKRSSSAPHNALPRRLTL
jgi:hypothetical protein